MSPRPGWVNVDCVSQVNPDVVCDLSRTPWPWPDNSVDEIFSSHLFEHLHILPTMNECHRILKPGGTLEVVVPYAMSFLQFQDPTHCSCWVETTPLYFVEDSVYPSYYTDRRFRLIFNRLCGNGSTGRGAVKTWRHSLRNLIPFRSTLKLVLMGMYDEVHFKLSKP